MIVLAMIYGVYAFLGFIGNLSVLLVVSIYRRFNQMRYFLLASLALSDFIFTMLVTSLRTVVQGLEKWIFGTTWCHGTAYLIRVLHFSTVLHLCAVSYERYDAIFQNPLCYNGRITKKRAIINITVLWVTPAVISLGPFLGWSNYVYNPDIFACEQKWDFQTTLPLFIVTFLVPLGLIAFLNYRVLTVVCRLQNSLKIIPVQNEKQSDLGNKLQDDQSQQKDKDKDRIERHQQHPGVLGRNVNTETPKPPPKQHVIELDTSKTNSGKLEGQRNATFQEDLEELKDTMHREKVLFRRNKIYSEFGCSSLLKKQKEDRTSLKNGCKPQMKTKQPLDDLEIGRLGNDYENISIESKTQLHLTGGHQLPRRIASHENKSFEDDNGICKAKQQGKIAGKGTIDEGESKLGGCVVIIKDKKSTKDLGIMSTTQETPQESKPCAYLSEAEKSMRQPLDDNKKDIGVMSTSQQSQETPQESKPCAYLSEAEKSMRQPLDDNEKDIGIMFTSQKAQETPQESKPNCAYPSEAEKIVCLPHDNVSGKEKERKPLRKTQRRFAKLLKEGKAARDVLVIISVFLVCYLPTWILGCYRAFGGEPSAEVILLNHCIYGTTMIWNPIIYSIRKKEFRKAVRKLMKL